jgi:hypothetical protein
MTGTIDRVEVITSVQRRRRWSAEDESDNRAGDLRAGDVGPAGGAPARDCAQSGVPLAAALRRGGAVGGGCRPTSRQNLFMGGLTFLTRRALHEMRCRAGGTIRRYIKAVLFYLFYEEVLSGAPDDVAIHIQ